MQQAESGLHRSGSNPKKTSQDNGSTGFVSARNSPIAAAAIRSLSESRPLKSRPQPPDR